MAFRHCIINVDWPDVQRIGVELIPPAGSVRVPAAERVSLAARCSDEECVEDFDGVVCVVVEGEGMIQIRAVYRTWVSI